MGWMKGWMRWGLYQIKKGNGPQLFWVKWVKFVQLGKGPKRGGWAKDGLEKSCPEKIEGVKDVQYRQEKSTFGLVWVVGDIWIGCSGVNGMSGALIVRVSGR